MVCPHCGHEVEDGQRFCNECGALLPDPTKGASPAGPQQGAARTPAGPGAGYARDYEPFDVTGPDETDVMHPVTPVDPVVAQGAGAQDDEVGEAQRHVGAREGRSQARDDGQADGQRPLPPDEDRAHPWAIIFGVVLGAVALVLFIMAFRSCSSQLASDSSGGAVVATSEAASTTEAATSATSAGDVAVRDSFAAYSWEELRQVADLIGAAPDYASAVEVAKTYHILNSDGTLPDDTKAVELTDGTTVDVRVAGIYHDDLHDGGGKAGITFVTTEVGAMHRMNADNTNVGGWRSSEMREWLNSDDGIYGLIPDDLRSQIVSVSKYTDNVGHATDSSAVSATTDKLWLLSVHEVGGDINWEWASDPTNSTGYNAIMNAEGAQYQLFSENAIDVNYPNAMLQLTDTSGSSQSWWLRSVSPSKDDHFRKVNMDGDPSVFDDSSIPYGVVFGFCL